MYTSLPDVKCAMSALGKMYSLHTISHCFLCSINIILYMQILFIQKNTVPHCTIPPSLKLKIKPARPQIEFGFKLMEVLQDDLETLKKRPIFKK